VSIKKVQQDMPAWPIARNARQKITDKYNLELFASLVESIYEEISE